MHKNRIIVISVVVEGRAKAEVARDYGVTYRWVHTLVTRYLHGGWDAIEPRSRRPTHSPTKIPQPWRRRSWACAASCPPPATTPAPTPSPSTSSAATGPPLPPPPSGRRSNATASSPSNSRNAPALPTSASRPNYPTRPGNPTSPTGASPPAPASRSSPSSTTTPGWHNQHRPHRSLDRRTPNEAYTAGSKATPAGTDGHWRIREDRIDGSGVVTLRFNSKMHHIGIGRAHKHERVRILIHNQDIRIIDPATGELLRDRTLDPSRDYQPQKPQNALPKEGEK